MSIIRQTLRPDFDVVVSRGATIEDTEAQLLRLTEEQFDALDLMADNERCLFEGPAGTGKTMLAFEYARRLSEAGHRTLLICFNRLLGDWFTRQVAALPHRAYLTSGSYFRLLREIIVRSSIATEFLEQESRGPTTKVYEDTYAVCGRLAVEELDAPYDALVMDEAQDLLQPHVLDVLNVWLRGGLASGRWAIFGDFQRQAIFGNQKGDQLKNHLNQVAPHSAKGRLTFNCRNTRNIGQETALLSGFTAPPYRMGQVLGLPVDYQYYGPEGEQADLLAAQVRRLLADGVRAGDVVVLSPLRLSNSGVAAVDGNSAFRLVDDHAPTRSRVPIIRYVTAHAFKGLESPVVILCDIAHVSEGEPQSLLYVGMSRARSHLIMLVQEKAKPAIATCIRRKLKEEWSAHP
jgi:DNA polymerase III delta prime subunit